MMDWHWFFQGLAMIGVTFLILTLITVIGAGLGCLWKEYVDG